MREVILDVETTGLDYKGGDKIIEVACVELVNHIATGNHIQFYCSTTKKINKDAENTHGLSNSFLDKFPSFLEQAQKLRWELPSDFQDKMTERTFQAAQQIGETSQMRGLKKAGLDMDSALDRLLTNRWGGFPVML